jgi:6-phosphogluconolactonase (cycloisomerase 2 family)
MAQGPFDEAQGTASAGRTVLYSTVGDTLTHWDIDVEAATLTRRGTFRLSSIVQYGWPHPSRRYLYLSSTDSERGSPGITGQAHFLTALRLGAGGEPAPHGEPQVLRQRPIHNSVDHSGRYAFTCYNAPSHLTVHAIGEDGTLGDAIPQADGLDLGVFCHQIQATPSNHAVLMVTRGNLPGPDKPDGDPGALKVFRFEDGRLSPLASIAPGGRGGYDYGPRHAAFHPVRPWAYVLVEFQNQLHMHRLAGDSLEPEPAFIVAATRFAPDPDVIQVPGAIHVHPRGHVLYASNRVSAKTHAMGPFPFEGGENNIAVFAIDPDTGEPKPIQFADPQGFHVRAFTIESSGRLLIAASLAPMTVRDGGETRTVPAGLSVFRIEDDGRLDFARRYDVETAPGVQQMWVRAITLPA